MAGLSAFSSHLFVLVLHCYLGTSSSSSSSSSPVKSSSRSASSSSSSQDDRSSSSLLQEVQVPLFLHMDQEDMVSEHMFRLYDKYNRESRLREGNTVRSFRAQRDTADQRTDTADQRTVYRLNLTSIQDTEVVLSATFHFLLDRRPTTNQRAWFCKRFKSPSCRSSLPVRPSPSVSLLFRSARPGGSSGVASGSSLLANVTFHPHRRGAWQMKDVTPVVKRAREKGHVLVWVELDSEEALPADAPPYVLLYADDRALGEPNSVAASLQRFDPFPEGGGGGGAEASSHSSHSHRSVPHGSNSSPEPTGRVRREAALLLSDPVHNNELPEVHYRPGGYMKDDLWERTWHLALKPKAKPKKKRKGQEGGGVPAEQDRGAEDVVGEPRARGGGGGKQAPPPQVPITNPPDQAADKKPRDEDGGLPDGEDVKSEDERRGQGKERKRHPGRAEGSKVQSPVLSFDERTMRKARRRQWGGEGGQDRGCTRRNLRVDFADIGWSEWVVAPKAFEAYYCAGTCGFPMPKVLRPSNHATIQSIVRAVGIIPGVPEPCCVPEKMSSLAVLYQDEARNLVLKVYPNMSIQSCSCR